MTSTKTTSRAQRLLALAGATALTLAGGCSRENVGAARQQGSAPVPVSVATVGSRSMPYQLQAIGTVVTSSTAGVKAQVGGILESVAFREGQQVAKGDLLFVIDPSTYRNALNQAEAQLARDQAQLDKAVSDVTRYTALRAKEFVTAEQLDQAKATADALAATVKADEAALDQAKLQLSYTRIDAPISGRTGDLLVHEGNLVKANADNPMVVINRIAPIDVGFAVPANYLDRIRAGQASGQLAVEARVKGDGEVPLDGRLTFINNTVDTSTGTILLKATFANREEQLWPGQFVDVVLTLGVQPDAVVAPAAAVVRSQEGTIAWVVGKDQTASSHDVKIDRSVGDEVVVASGLAPGDTVVTDGQLRLSPGATVTIKQGGSPSGEAPGGGAPGEGPDLP